MKLTVEKKASTKAKPTSPIIDSDKKSNDKKDDKKDTKKDAKKQRKRKSHFRTRSNCSSIVRNTSRC